MAKKPSKNLEPSLNGDGRDDGGKFSGGNKGGPGNPLAKQVNMLRAQLLKAVTVEDIKAIGERLVDNAKAGDIQSIKELFDRLFGKPNGPMQSDEDPGGRRVQVMFNFDHEAFAKLFRAGHVDGRATAPPDDPEEPVH